MEIPKERRPPTKVNPNMMIIYSIPKAGKTTICAALPDSLILELEPNGASFVDCRVMEINKPSEFDEALTLIANSPEKVCENLVVDTITKLDEWSEIVGTYNYMNKSQGQKFNRVGGEKGGQKILHTDKRFETVHQLGEGYGYQHSRNVMTDYYDRLNMLVSEGKVGRVIMLCHVKDKSIETVKGNMVEYIDLNLTGRVKSIFATRVDAVGHFHRKGRQGFLNFDNDFNKVVAGGRCNHLDGEFLISEKLDDGTIATYWDKVFIKKEVNV